jgi:hypothetical protein
MTHSGGEYGAAYGWHKIETKKYPTEAIAQRMWNKLVERIIAGRQKEEEEEPK